MDWNFGEVMLTMMMFFIWVLFITMFISAFADIFRRHDLSGWAKVGWILLLMLFPFLGIFIYMVTRPTPTAEELYAAGYPVRSYSSADEIEKLASLHERGAISEEEYAHLKRQVAIA